MAIQQHPIPQDISNYRFRLIGDMTIKQFASLGIAIVAALITYSLPLPFFFKYPFSVSFLLLGVGMAFVPIQGRSLDVWILAFIRSIYSPTQYVWKKSTDTEVATPAPSTPTNQQAVAPPITSPVVNIVPPQSTSTNTVNTAVSQSISTPTPTTTSAVPTQSVNPPIPVNTISTNTPTPTAVTNTIPTTPTPTANAFTTPIQTTATIKPLVTPTISPNIPPDVNSTPPTTTTTTTQSPSQLPIPFTPLTPNTLVGLTLTPDGRILDGVMVEIKKNNLTLRATKSNKLGQFIFARPLENGTFQIIAEKDSFHFSPYSMELTGQIVKPLKIQSDSQKT